MKDNHFLLGIFLDVRKVTFAAALLMACTPVQAAINSMRVASGLSRPVYVTAPPDDTNRLFIVEQWTGKIKILNRDGNAINATPFLTISGLSTGSEQGLLGLAFDPNYAANGRFYVNYTDSSGNTQVRRYERSSSDPNLANPASSLPILSIAQPQSNHNGGWLGFGPNGYLYISSGDGGGDYDDDAGHDVSVGNGQSLGTMLGKMLRVDINNDAFPADPNKNYAIPVSNPFAAGGGLPEIWAYGLRNPWRPSFDRATGNLWIADVGQATREEINFQTASSLGGVNYGWRLREGLIQTPNAVGGPKPPGAVDPIFDYPHSGGGVSGISVTGGYVYRGPIAELQGQYFFSDYGNPKLWTLTYDGTTLSGPLDLTSQLVPNVGVYNQIVSFGEDGEGNLYIVDLDGEVFKVGPDRTDHPSGDAEKVSVANGRVTRIHRNIAESDAHGEYTGVACFSANGAVRLREHYHRNCQQFAGKVFSDGRTFEKAYLIQLFQKMVEAGEQFAHVDTPGGYIEIDTQQDFDHARRCWTVDTEPSQATEATKL